MEIPQDVAPRPPAKPRQVPSRIEPERKLFSPVAIPDPVRVVKPVAIPEPGAIGVTP